MAGKLEEYLTQELGRTGYPLEIEISSMFDESYLVSNNEYFFDWDENEPREIDISAFAFPSIENKHGGAKINPFSLSHRLVIECKKSDTHAWIFLTRPEKKFWAEGQSMDFLRLGTRNAGLSFLDEILETCKSRLHYQHFKRVASTYAEIKYAGRNGKSRGRKSGKSEIFEAKNQLVKYVAYDIAQLLKRLTGIGFNPMKNHLISLYYPTIVFDGKLYEAIVRNGFPKLYKRRHLLLSTKYSPPYIKDFPETESPELEYLIDVVRKDFFPDFLQILQNDYSVLWKSIYDNLEELKKEAKDYLRV